MKSLLQNQCKEFESLNLWRYLCFISSYLYLFAFAFHLFFENIVHRNNASWSYPSLPISSHYP